MLEVGTGSGYQAAVIAQLVRTVYSVEIIPSLAESPRRKLDQLDFTTVHIKVADGAEGWPEQAPFDAIAVACAAPALPPALVDQLATGGRIAIPIGDHFSQSLHVYKKTRGLAALATLPLRFVPMIVGSHDALPKSDVFGSKSFQANPCLPESHHPLELEQRRLLNP